MNFNGVTVNNRYRIESLLKEDHVQTVYRAHEISGRNRPLLVSFLKNSAISGRIEDIIRFKMELHVVSEMDHENIISVYDAGEFLDHYYFSFEYVDAVDLHDLLARGLSLEQGVDIAIQACRGLDYLHSRNMLHKNLNPGSLFLRGERVLIAGFGLSHIIRFDHVENRDDLIEIFRYMAPEQCRFLPGGVDERSDLYALGAILYRMISGRDPFEGRSINSIIHKHLAYMPVRPGEINPEVPDIIDRIVMKLLDKEPDCRYQGARGLLSDLEKYAKGRRDFILGLDDHFTRLGFRARLIGRERELERLTDLYGGARAGKGGVCIVAGEAGCGKSRLLDELRAHVYARGGAVIQGTCSVKSYKVPYGPFIEAIGESIGIYSGLPENDKKRIVDELRMELMGLGDVIIKLVPAMKDILGECPPLVPLDPESEIQRFLMVTVRFLLKMSGLGKNLCMVLEDLHLADDGTIALFSELLDHIERHSLALFVSIRDDEVPEGHGLMKILRKLETATPPGGVVRLGMLDLGSMKKLVSALLVEEERNIIGVSDYVQGKSRGNPFFAIEILKQLLEENLLAYRDDAWHFDRAGVEDVGISDSIVTIILTRIRKLDDSERRVLSHAAVIGERFTMRLLFAISDYDEAEVVRIVDKAIGLHILVGIQEHGEAGFAHHRIKEAFYNDLTDVERREVHLAVANAIDEGNRNNYEAVIFDMAHHCIEAGDMERALIFSYPAGVRALRQWANEDALAYFRLSMSLLEELDLVDSDHGLNILKNMTAAHLSLGDFDEAIAILDRIIPRLGSVLEKLEAYASLCDAYRKKGEWLECEKSARRAFALLGHGIPESRVIIMLAMIGELALHLLLGMYRGVRRPARRDIHPFGPAIGRLALSLIWSYAFSDTAKFVWLSLRSLNVAERRFGISFELGMALGGYGAFLMSIPLFRRAIAAHERALAMRRNMNDRWGTAQSLQLLGVCYLWKSDCAEALDRLEKSADIFLAIGDMREYAFSALLISQTHAVLSDCTLARNYAEESYRISLKSRDSFGMSSYWLMMARTCLYTGDYGRAEECGIKCMEISRDGNIHLLRCQAGIMLGYLNLEKGDIAKAASCLADAQILMNENRFLKYYTLHIYPLMAETAIAEYLARDETGKRTGRRMMREIRRRCNTAMGKTARWPLHRAMSLLVSAKYHAMAGNGKRAARFFQMSIELYDKIGSRYNLARAQYEYGLFIFRSDDGRNARMHLERAFAIFTEIGAGDYAARIRGILGIGEGGVSSSMEQLLLRERMNSVIGLARDIRRLENQGERLNATLARAAEIAGARRGWIFMADQGNRLEIKAAVSLEGRPGAPDEFSMTIVESVFASGKPMVIEDALNDEATHGGNESGQGTVRSVLSIPIIERDSVIGVCYMDNSLSAGVFGEKELDLLLLFLSSVSRAGAGEGSADRLEKTDPTGKIHQSSIPVEKMNRAMDYIKSNYRSDISREGLAARVGIHHDNLGKYFKIHFGRKMGDFINELRIRDAVRKLTETDDRIVDIAFSVGFGSISTFNKAFRKIMKATPESFRKRGE